MRSALAVAEPKTKTAVAMNAMKLPNVGMAHIPVGQSTSARTMGSAGLDRWCVAGAGSDEFQPQLATDDRRRSLQGRQGHIAILRIEQPTHLASAGLHALGQALARKITRPHGFRDLP